MNNASRILSLLDKNLNTKVELTLYGRAALRLGFDNPRDEYALSKDIDAVFWIGQAESLLEKTNFWEAVEKVNEELADQELYISHFVTEDQVVLTKSWIRNRDPIKGNWKNLLMFRLHDAPIGHSVSPDVRPRMDEASPRVQATHEPERGSVGDAVVFTVYTAGNAGVIARAHTRNGVTLPSVMASPRLCTMCPGVEGTTNELPIDDSRISWIPGFRSFINLFCKYPHHMLWSIISTTGSLKI